MDGKVKGYMEGLPNRALVVISRTVKDVLLSKGVILALVFLLIPPLISVYTLLDPQEGMKEWWDMFAGFGVVLYLQLLVLLYSLVYGSSMIHDALDRKTMTYFTIRSAKRFEIVLWKYIGTTISIMVLFTISVFLNYIILAGHGPFDDLVGKLDVLGIMLLTVYIGILVYIALFSMIGVAFKRPLMIGLLFSFFWEVIMVNLPTNIRLATIMHYLRSVFLSNKLVSDAIDLGDMTESVFSVVFLLVLAVIFLAGGMVLLSSKDVN
jgi:ABC-type transport system involved in multi-copper enzyme maturation permease subunit